jgi:uncharacterized protein
MTARPPADRDATIAALVRAAVPDVVAVYRFGSSVSGTDRPDSDVDVAFLAPRPLDAIARFDLQEQVASAIHRSVDLVDLRRASTVMASQVVTTGLVIDEPDPDARGRFEDYVYGAYARLNEERRGILERVAAEGTVYGR